MIGYAKSIRSQITATLAACALFGGAGAMAGPFEGIETLDQNQFRLLSESLGAATHFKAVSPAESLGIIGFDLAAELSSTSVDKALFDQASNGDYDQDALYVARVHAQKGLPFGIDVGAFVSTVPTTDLNIFGAEIRLAVLEGDFATPAVGLRASYSQIQGASELDLSNASLDISVSKGFLMLTPYAGAGIVRTKAEALAAESTLSVEEFDQEKLFVGLNVNLGFNLAFEADRTGGLTSYSAKAGIRF